MSPFMNRTDRMYAIVEELRARGRRGCTSQHLADKLSVSLRTIKRDLAALQAAGTRIEGQEGRGGGYRLNGDILPPVELTSAEVAALAIAVGANPELPFATDARTALTKLARLMSEPQRAELDSILGRVWLRARESVWRASTRACVRTIDEAVRRGVSVSIDYEDASGNLSRTRRVDPLAVARTRGVWYVLGWCHQRAAGRWFRFDRIRRATLTRRAVLPRALDSVFGEPPVDAHPIKLWLQKQ
jgi:predicted DNA-binding transcriptional regulator YafY